MNNPGRQPTKSSPQDLTDQLPSLVLENPLWRFAVDLWRSEALQNACLALQDNGWVVSHLIVALWRADSGHHWDAAEPAAITHWRHIYTAPLRQMRRELASKDTTLGLRRKVAEAELEAERIELALWHRHFDESWIRQSTDDGPNTSMKTGESSHQVSQDPARLAAMNLTTLAKTRHFSHHTALLQALMLAYHPSLRLDEVVSLLDVSSATQEESAS
ncbi:TIGR02444 family protein [Mangrovitalea sediminis]|uniref:TIGR02444 family protein n=1 Tax=Mangrovitalea sediminis TaxID=1982043 RepID=UPI0013045824|nr:TIGR02444 family protein [Mangrovitalea sediminis]